MSTIFENRICKLVSVGGLPVGGDCIAIWRCRVELSLSLCQSGSLSPVHAVHFFSSRFGLAQLPSSHGAPVLSPLQTLFQSLSLALTAWVYARSLSRLPSLLAPSTPSTRPGRRPRVRERARAVFSSRPAGPLLRYSCSPFYILLLLLLFENTLPITLTHTHTDTAKNPCHGYD